MPERGPRGNYTAWTEEELEVLRAAPQSVTSRELATQLPGRSLSSIANLRIRLRESGGHATYGGTAETPEAKEPGEYVETLNAYFYQHTECVEIWMKWHGYVTYRELCRDMKASPLGIVTLLCEAK
jgi:hypothetical protein